MVPSKLRDQSPHSFTPRAVSIGPLHRQDKNVQEFEDQKATYLHILLERLHVPPDQVLKSCFQKVTASIDRIRACYGYSRMKSYTDVELATMMVMDACFILEFIRLPIHLSKLLLQDISLQHSIDLDLVLVENQISFFVLQYIFDCTPKSLLPTRTSLAMIILRHFKFLNPFKAANYDVDGATVDHIVGLLQRSFHPSNITSPCKSAFPKNRHTIVQLDKAGVKFNPNKDANWKLDMKFSPSRFACFCHCLGNPTLKMPTLYIQGNTELIFRNIIAYEQCTRNGSLLLTSYVVAMDMLVNTADDIVKLVQSKVISHNLGSNEAAANMINELCQHIVIESFYYGKQWQQLDDYCNSYWPKHIAWLKYTYFNSPWNVIALIAALILFTLTMVQTFFAINPA